MELNLEQPIFVIYLDVDGLTRQRAQEKITKINEYYGQYINATFWIFPAKENKVELIWNGNKHQLYKDPKDQHIQNVVDHVNKVLQILSDGTSDEAIKSQLRNLQLSKILD